MSANDIVTLIDAEVAKLQHARALIVGKVNRGPERRKSTTDKPKKKKWNLTPEGRARIGQAVRKRWDAQRKATKLIAEGLR